MRLIHRPRNHRSKAPRISISQQEIAADLHYPATRLPGGKVNPARARGAAR
jgi:hypothetical protein